MLLLNFLVLAATAAAYTEYRGGSGVTAGSFHPTTVLEDESLDTTAVTFTTQDYILGSNTNIGRKWELNIGGRLGIFYGEGMDTHIVRYAGGIGLSYVLLGAPAATTDGTDFISVHEQGTYGILLTSMSYYNVVDLFNISEADKVKGSNISVHAGLELRVRPAPNYSVGLSFSQTMISIPIGSSLVRVYETSSVVWLQIAI